MVFDNVEDRPSELGDPSTLPPLWASRAVAPDVEWESSRPIPARPRVRRGSAGGWWPGLMVFGGIVAGGLLLLNRVLR